MNNPFHRATWRWNPPVVAADAWEPHPSVIFANEKFIDNYVI
jgi:hypothetical protein